MSRTHPPTLSTLARAALAREIGIARGDRILVAVSGGPDSMALLHVLAGLQGKLSVEVLAHGVDHGLRAEASAELDLAESLACKLSVPFHRTVVSVAQGGNLQARARAARHAALRSAAEVATCRFIATAHHADDRAETVLIRLMRGAGPRGLAVLPPRDGDLIRPFIRARKPDVFAHLRRHSIEFAVDPSNISPRFLRARVRAEALPLLEALSPSIVPHLCSLADQLSPQRAHDAFPLSRATVLALTELARTRKGEVLLPNALIVRAGAMKKR